MAPAIALEVLAHRGRPLALVHHEVDEAQLLELRSVVQPAAQDQLLGAYPVEPAAEQAVSSHAREQVEQHLRQAHSAVALGNDHVIGERMLEPAAQGVALNQPDRQQGKPHLAQVLVYRIDAGIGIAAQVRCGARADEAGEQGEIAA